MSRSVQIVLSCLIVAALVAFVLGVWEATL